MEKLIQDKLKIQMKDLEKIDISHGKLIAFTKDGNSKQVPIKETKKYNWASCQYCRDYTAEFADISAGSVGKPEEGWNSVIIRTDVGKKLFDSAVAAKKLKIKEEVDLSFIKKESLKKKSKIKQLDEKVFSAMRFLNISDSEIKTYAALVSLGQSDMPMLNKIMKLEESEIQEILDSLIKREWVFISENFYKPINPTKVIKEEINNFRRNFEKNIKRIESEALVDLETLFEQNNLMYVRFKEFIDELM
jgi:predicted transcriptional regulator